MAKNKQNASRVKTAGKAKASKSCSESKDCE